MQVSCLLSLTSVPTEQNLQLAPLPCNLTCIPDTVPTFSPTTVPTQGPSLIPTNEPHALPSSSPTYRPSPFPTEGPSDYPTSRHPSVSPSLSPVTKDPTEEPSSEDTITPSSTPSYQPTLEHDTAPSTPRSSRFADECTSYFLSPSFLEDGILSQIEFTQFITHHCIQNELCDDAALITFEELDVSLQLEFILGVCSHKERVDKEECIDELRDMWRNGREFGFAVDSEVDMQLLTADVRDVCDKSYGYVLEMGFAVTIGELS